MPPELAVAPADPLGQLEGGQRPCRVLPAEPGPFGVVGMDELKPPPSVVRFTGQARVVRPEGVEVVGRAGWVR